MIGQRQISWVQKKDLADVGVIYAQRWNLNLLLTGVQDCSLSELDRSNHSLLSAFELTICGGVSAILSTGCPHE